MVIIQYMDAITHMDENAHMLEIDLIFQWMKCDMDEIAFLGEMAIIHIGWFASMSSSFIHLVTTFIHIFITYMPSISSSFIHVA